MWTACLSKLLGLSQLVVGGPRWAFGGCCTRCGRIIGHFTVHRTVGYISSGSSTVSFGVSCELLRSWDTSGKVHGRWHDTSPCDNERAIVDKHTPSSRGEVLGGDTPPGPRSCESVHALSAAGQARLPRVHDEACLDLGRALWPSSAH